MASAQKISQLTTAGPLTGAELLPIVQSGGTLQTTVSTLVAFANVSLIPVVSALQTQIAQVSALTSINAAAITSLGGVVATYDSRIDTVSAAVVSIGAVVSALEVRVSAASATGASNTAAITSVNNVVSALEVRVSAVSAVASALDVRISNVSASVSVLNVQMVQALASISAINSVLATIDTSAITGLEARVSALEIRVTDVSALTSANTAAIASVNAVVSLKVFRNGDYLTNVQYIDFNTTTSYATSAGRLTWDITHGTLDLGLSGTVNLLIGQRTVAQIYNNSGVTLPKGKAVKVTGAQGQRLTGALAQADSDSDSATIFGLMLETVSNLGTGYVATDGVVLNVDTAAYTDGQIVYLSPVSAGELTPTKPIAPQHLVQMGYVVKGNSVGGGSLYVKVQNGYELGELHNVKTSAEASIANGEVLAWNVSASVWTNSTALIDTQASVSALNIELAAVSARTSVNAAAITSINNVVSALEVRVSSVSTIAAGAKTQVDAVSVLVSALTVQVNTVSAALTSTNNVVSALEIRVSTVSARASAIQAQVNTVSVLVSALDIRVAAVSASVSALQVQVNTVSAALTSTNNVVSALEIRVSTVSAATSAVQVQVNAVSVQVSALQVQVNTVSAAVSAALVSVGQRVLKAGDTMSGELNMADNLVTRPKFKDYALQAVIKGNVSATTTLDLLEANYFQVTAAGSTTFVFANPPVSAATGPAAGGFILELANGGAATVTWPTATKWPSATAPTLTSSGTDILVFVTDDGGTTWRGVQSIKDSR
jgi:predicted  nucleic acid-binding Zn-ribbon protein